MPLPDLLRVLVIALACTAGIIDIRTRKIPNWLCAVGLVAGFASRLYLEGAAGLLTAAEGMGLAILIFFPLWLLRGMGAGDVKLMAALGAIAGPAHWVVLAIAAGIIGGIGGVILAQRYGRLASTFANTARLTKELLMLRAPARALPETDIRHPNSLRLPYGAVIGLAAVILAVLEKL